MRRGLGQEDKLHKKFGALMKRYSSLNQLNSVWYSYDASGENRDLGTGALLKAKGLRPGKSDYEFKIVNNSIAEHIYIEFKTEKGKQSDSQKAFEETCYASNEHYYIARSVPQALEILTKHKIIK